MKELIGLTVMSQPADIHYGIVLGAWNDSKEFLKVRHFDVESGDYRDVKVWQMHIRKLNADEAVLMQDDLSDVDLWDLNYSIACRQALTEAALIVRDHKLFAEVMRDRKPMKNN